MACPYKNHAAVLGSKPPLDVQEMTICLEFEPSVRRARIQVSLNSRLESNTKEEGAVFVKLVVAGKD